MVAPKSRRVLRWEGNRGRLGLCWKGKARDAGLPPPCPESLRAAGMASKTAGGKADEKLLTQLILWALGP